MTTQYGIFINGTPTWSDLLGDLSLKSSGAGTPTLAALMGGNVLVPFFAANDIATLTFHLPHDYVQGSDLFLHTHWCHNGTAISGSLVNTFEATYAKGHNQANFPAVITATQTISTPNIATVPQYRHRIDEFQLSAASPNANQFNSSIFEPDGLLLVAIKPTTIPTITGGSQHKPAILFVDLHYQSTNVGTVNKAPNFYGP